MAIWYVPLSNILDAHQMRSLTPFAFAASAIAALTSPLLVGAVADRHASPMTVLRWIAGGSAVFSALVCWALDRGAGFLPVFLLIQLLALISMPSWSLLNTIALSRLDDARRQFGPVRALGTIGWMAGCLTVSLFEADTSTRAGYLSALVWLGLGIFALAGGSTRPLPSPRGATLRERLGLDALSLLRNRNHRVVLLTAGLISAPLAAFYPFTPPHLLDLGLRHTSAWMSLAQVTEIFAMFGLGALLARARLKWILAAGLAFALARYLLLATDSRGAVLTGISLHGFAFTLFFVTAPIYLNERVDTAWRARAQALLSSMTQGLGNLIGYLGSGWWLNACTYETGVRWSWFWGGLAAVVAGVLVYFLAAYRIQTGVSPRAAEGNEKATVS